MQDALKFESLVRLTFGAGWAALGQLECVSVCAQRLLLVAVEKFPEGVEASLGPVQNVISRLAPHNLTVLVVRHRIVLKVKGNRLADDRSKIAFADRQSASHTKAFKDSSLTLTPTTKDINNLS